MVEEKAQVMTLPAGTIVSHVPRSAQIGLQGTPNPTTDTYFIHDNGGRPFKVTLESKEVRVFRETGWDEENGTQYGDEPILTFAPQQVFIGRSPFNQMTSFSGGHGAKFDGNSILLHIKNLEYVYIGSCIKKFEAKAPINKYVSPVGNNDVPYPCAVDKEGRHYLMIEDVIINSWQITDENDDPYDFYYANQQVIADPKHCCHMKTPLEFGGIKKVWIGTERCYLWYQPERKDLGYDWTRGAYPEKKTEHYHRSARKGYKLFGQRKRGEPKFEITRDMYMDIMTQFAEQKGFSPLNAEILHKRIF